MVTQIVRGKEFFYARDLEVKLPDVVAIKNLTHTMDSTGAIKIGPKGGEKSASAREVIEAVGQELADNRGVREMLLHEGTPTSLKFSVSMGTQMFDDLAGNLGYDVVGQREGDFGTYYVVTAETPKRGERRGTKPGETPRVYRDTTGVNLTDDLKGGYQGDGIIVVPIPKKVIDDIIQRSRG